MQVVELLRKILRLSCPGTWDSDRISVQAHACIKALDNSNLSADEKQLLRTYFERYAILHVYFFVVVCLISDCQGFLKTQKEEITPACRVVQRAKDRRCSPSRYKVLKPLTVLNGAY